MRNYLLDTNVFSVHASGKDSALSALVKKHSGSIILSAVALAEMEYGWQIAEQETKRIKKQKAFARDFVPTPFTGESARFYGLVKSSLDRGELIGERDTLLAAQAMELGAVLVTHNTRELKRVPGLDIEDWQTPKTKA